MGYIDSRVIFYGRWHKSKKLKEGKELYLCCIFWHLDINLLNEIKILLNSNSKIEKKQKNNLPFYKLVIDKIEEKNKLINYISKYKLKSKKIKKYKYWKILLNLENIYLETGIQDIKLIDKFLMKFTLTMEDNELNKI